MPHLELWETFVSILFGTTLCFVSIAYHARQEAKRGTTAMNDLFSRIGPGGMSVKTPDGGQIVMRDTSQPETAASEVPSDPEEDPSDGFQGLGSLAKAAGVASKKAPVARKKPGPKPGSKRTPKRKAIGVKIDKRTKEGKAWLQKRLNHSLAAKARWRKIKAAQAAATAKPPIMETRTQGHLAAATRTQKQRKRLTPAQVQARQASLKKARDVLAQRRHAAANPDLPTVQALTA